MAEKPGHVQLHVVAGATGRIGGALVRRLLDTDGTAVVGIARDRAGLNELASRYGDSFRPCVADLLADSAVERIRAVVGEREVGLVVNSTRSVTPGSVEDVEPGKLAHAVDLKAGGLLRLVRAVDKGLREGSRVIAVGGRLGYDADPAASAAGIANASVALLIRQLAQVLGPRGVSCHVVAPGAMAVDAVPGSGASAAPQTLPSGSGRLSSPLGHLPSADDVAWMISVLAHPTAAFLNGGSLIMDGGRRTSVP